MLPWFLHFRGVVTPIVTVLCSHVFTSSRFLLQFSAVMVSIVGLPRRQVFALSWGYNVVCHVSVQSRFCTVTFLLRVSVMVFIVGLSCCHVFIIVVRLQRYVPRFYVFLSLCHRGFCYKFPSSRLL